jgi:hypothetical protein
VGLEAAVPHKVLISPARCGRVALVVAEKQLPDAAIGEPAYRDPAVLLRWYAKCTKKADTSAAAVIGALSKGVLGS